MNQNESYDDPTLASRVRAWMEVAAPVAAPERLVFSVMDDVQRAPRGRRFAIPGFPIVTGVARYAALTLVITIGVAAGILVSRNLENVGGPTPSPTPVPSLRSLGEITSDGRLLTSGPSGAWLVTGADQLVPIDAEGRLGVPIALDFAPSDIVARVDLLPAAAERVWLVAPDTDLVRLEPGVGDLAVAEGASGTSVTHGPGVAWVSRAGEVLKVDSGLLTILAIYAVPDHDVGDPMLVVGTTLWVVGASGIERLDSATGDRDARINITASALIGTRGLVWAAQGSGLIAIDATTGQPGRTAQLPSDASDILALATRGETIWVAAESGSGLAWLTSVDAETGQVTSLTPLATPVTSIAVVGNQVWTLDQGGHVDRFEPGS